MEPFSESLQATVDLGPAAIAQFTSHIDPAWIEEALSKGGHASCRRRKLPMEAVVWLVIGMGLFADRSIIDVVDHLELTLPDVTKLAESAVSQARYRLGVQPIEWLFYKTAAHWSPTPKHRLWKGLSTHAIDGTTLRVADSDDNFVHFGKPGGRNGTSDAGYPQARVAALLNIDTRLLEAANTGSYDTSELVLAEPLLEHIPDNSLTILDRGFAAYGLISKLVSLGTNRHVMLRAKCTTKLNVVNELPDGSKIVDWPCTKTARKADPSVPDFIRGRLVEYQVEGGVPSRIFTTLLDPVEATYDELVALYHERWEVELAFDEVKTHMLERKEALRSKKPEGVAQEIWGMLLLYNLVRYEMLKVADQRSLPANRVSFKSSLLLMRSFWEVVAWRFSPGNIPRYLTSFRSTLDILILPERRRLRTYPRHVKIKMSNFPRNRGRGYVHEMQKRIEEAVE